ncbi:MAG: AAC(3) family N-acetyltransferase [Bacteroidetes bacterium GWF2_33_38]|nr:MAG: AAC(3) family N-acetyltransferase [Bacteroidetes bacterium GWF2_33_38]OFY89242.1 MAG: AAC(3) family N-acetyltransferase [Bacteroidetes bacterium RIFOXYA2_FULL_33_7]
MISLEQSNNHIIKKAELIADLRNIGLKEGDLLHLKVSLKSIGKIEGGAKTLIEAFLEVLGDKGTIVSDAFVTAHPLPLSKKNSTLTDDFTPSYAGGFANAMIKHPNIYRSKHPIQKFAAIGYLAKELTENHTDKSGGYELLNEMAKMEAKNLTIGKKVVGVGTTHVAIEHLGFVKKYQNKGVRYKNSSGEVSIAKMNWHGGCGRGFPNFFDLYDEKGGTIRKGKVGQANALLTDMKKTLEIEIEKLKIDPTFFFCHRPGCIDCRLNWKHSTGNPIVVRYHWLIQNFKEKSIKGFLLSFWNKVEHFFVKLIKK